MGKSSFLKDSLADILFLVGSCFVFFFFSFNTFNVTSHALLTDIFSFKTNIVSEPDFMVLIIITGLSQK